ncbi:uncharacterized protein LOC143250860 [Tachypleus tridentatus]|uniref:uncharacterized protein LOC143250860 n=1 Tax=Tachypleus tridentatus TaxID=6853 RepID=UPI003FD23E51
MGGRMPEYRYSMVGPMQLYQAVVLLPNGLQFFSTPAATQHEASESAAEEAIVYLNRMRYQEKAALPSSQGLITTVRTQLHPVHRGGPPPLPLFSPSASGPQYSQKPHDLVIQRHPPPPPITFIPDSFVNEHRKQTLQLQSQYGGSHNSRSWHNQRYPNLSQNSSMLLSWQGGSSNDGTFFTVC